MKWPWVLIALLCTPVAQAANYASRDDVRQFIDEMVERHGYEYARRKGLVAMVGGKNKTAIRNATPAPFRDVLLAIARSVA